MNTSNNIAAQLSSHAERALHAVHVIHELVTRLGAATGSPQPAIAAPLCHMEIELLALKVEVCITSYCRFSLTNANLDNPNSTTYTGANRPA